MLKTRLLSLNILVAVLALSLSIIPTLAMAQIAKVTDNGGYEVFPQILDDGPILWQGWDGQDYEIYCQMPGQAAAKLTDNTSPDARPQMNALGQFTWMNWDGRDWEVWYNLGAGPVQLTNNSGAYDVQPQITADAQIFWQGWDGQDYEIFRYNTSTRVITKLTDNTRNDTSPQINASGQLTWTQWDGKNWQVFYDLGDGPIQLTHSTSGSNLSPQITDNGQIYWQGWDGQDYEIYCFSPWNRVTEQLTDNTVADTKPAVKNGALVWSQWDGHDNEIYFMEFGVTRQITDDEFNDLNPQINSSRQIVWQKWDGQDWEINNEVVNSPYFSWDNINGKLLISTPTLSLGFESGAVIYLEDNVRKVKILDTQQSINLPDATTYFSGFTSYNGNEMPNRMPNKSEVNYAESGHTATLTYGPCYTTGKPVEGTSLIYQFVIDSSGDISISVTATESATGYWVENISIPIMNYEGSAVITGPWRIARGDNSIAKNDFYGSNIPAAVIEGTNSCVGVWNENDRMQRERIRLIHNQNNYDHILLYSYPEPVQQETNQKIMYAGPWRFTARANWLDVAKAWRTHYEELHPDVTYLWENPVEWVRNIHCVYSRSHSENPSNWANVAAVVSPTKTLIMPYHNLSSELVVYGDVDYRMTWCRPTETERSYWESQGYNYKVQGYYEPFYYFTNANNHVIRHPQLLPSSYTYPDDLGYDITDSLVNQTQEVWDNYWSGVTAAYYSGSVLTQMHPGATKTVDYVNYNFPAFMKAHDHAAAFWDMLGDSQDAKFKEAGRRIFNGKSYEVGARDLVAAHYDTYPIMGEWINVGMLPYVWYWWQGSYTLNWNYGLTPNHPFQTALMGSYCWTLDQRPTASFNHVTSALLGGLPEFFLDGDYQADSFAPYSRARAQLFCTYELYNDLPTTWKTGALAYYRSNTGNMFRFEPYNGGYRYVEETPGGDVVRLTYPLQ